MAEKINHNLEAHGRADGTEPVDAFDVDRLAELFRIFADSTRLRILTALSGKELCVNEVAVDVGMTLSAVSHQLAILKRAELVRSRREGKAIYYRIADEHVRTIISNGAEHINE